MRRSLAVVLTALILSPLGGARAEESDTGNGFPEDALLPKAEIGADRFLEKHPAFDGRGITVAIFDTGVDPGAAGLSMTTEGKPKIVDLVDGTGSGDVDTSTVRKAEDGKLKGLSGRTLTLGGTLKCPKNEWHVGVKAAYDFFPRGLIRRLTKKRKKAWDEKQRTLTAALVAQVHALRDVEKKAELERRRDLELRIEQLEALQGAWKDPGPLYDCVVFHDGKVWRAVIDTDEDGDLADEKALAPYRVEHQHGTFSAEDRLNYGINVYRGGDRLSIVADCGAHGTHVAGIVAAHFPDQPELSGLAPGAQIVAVKIGDPRLGSSSTGTGEERGLVAVLRNGCDLINMSYGGPSATPDRTRMARIYSEIVNEHGVIWVGSAGNEGPGLSTVGSPAGSTSALFGVGAYVSPAMGKAQYAMRKDVPPTHYTWSSRGPTLDGDLGVDFSAPGGAIAPVPNWSLQGETQMHGTSMSSPNLCGGVALLLSGLKAQGIPWSANRVRRALANTAKQVEGIERFALGHGLVQVPEAFDYAVRWKDEPEEDVRFQVTLPRRDDARGIHLREPFETDRVCETRVRVKPHFREKDDHGKRIEFAMRLNFEASEPWVEAPGHLALLHGGGNFELRVDPRELPPGAHYAEVRAFDAEAPGRGPLFRVPITVIRPLAVDPATHAWTETLSLEAGAIRRRFFAVPEGATWADLRLRTTDADAGRLIVLQTTQLLPGRHSKDGGFEGWVRMPPGADIVRTFRAVGGRTLELDIAQYWSSLGASTFDAELHFHGLVPSDETLFVDGADTVTPIDVTAPLRREHVELETELSWLRRPLRPTDSTIQPGDAERDLLPDQRLVHELVLTYPVSLSEGARVRPTPFQGENEDVWEAWSSSLYTVTDANKRVVGRGPIWDEKKTLKLAKGDYTLRLHLRHEDPKRLEALEQAVLFLDVKLDKAIQLPLYDSVEAALKGGPPAKARTLERGERARFYAGAIATKAWPKLAAPGDHLRGTIHYGKKDENRFGHGRREKGYPLRVLVPPPASKKPASAKASSKPKSPTQKSVDEALLDAQVAELAALRKANTEESRKLFAALAQKVLKQKPGHLPVLEERLKLAVARKRGVLEAAAKVMARINPEALATYYGVKREPETDKDKARHKRMEGIKGAYVEALYQKARALSRAGAKKRDAFDDAFDDVKKWAPMDKPRFVELRIDHELAHERLGEALKLLQGLIKKSPDKKKLRERRVALLEQLGWKDWAAHERAWIAVRFPAAFPPF